MNFIKFEQELSSIYNSRKRPISLIDFANNEFIYDKAKNNGRNSREILSAILKIEQ